MEKPEKLFANAPEWSEGDGLLQWSNRETGEFGNGETWKVHVGTLFCELEEFGGVVIASVWGQDSKEFSARSPALDWLRQRILAHRDELIRVTGDG